MYSTVIEILLIWLAFILVYFQEHFKNVWHILRPNPFSWQRWWAVMKGTVTKRTIFPLIVVFLLTVAIVFVNNWQINDLTKTRNKENTVLIQSVNETINNAFNESGIKETNQKLQDLIDRIDIVLEQNSEILKRLESQNEGTTKTE